MSSEPTIVDVNLASKRYEIYESPRGRLQQFLVPRLQGMLGLPEKKYFRAFNALEDVSFSVRRGETVGIIGRNGSGKSTLLQIICGTLTPTSGTVTTHGRIAALLELGSGFNPEFSGRENVYLNGAVLGLSAKQIDERYADIAAFADIGEFIDQPIKTYSSGMVVRLAFATAIHVDPDILVVDEALSVGDTAFQQKCLNRIRLMQRNGVSILLVTHSANALIEYCDRGIYLKRGKMVMDGACRDVVKVYTDDLVQEEGGIAIASDPVAPVVEATTVVAQQEAVDVALRVESVQVTDLAGQPIAAVEYGDRLRVQVRVVAEERIESPCFGVQLASVDGIALWSTTTLGMNLSVPAMEPGTHVIAWDLQANFSGNRYVLSIGAGYILNGEYRRLHRLDYAGHFDVIPVPNAGGGWLAPMPRFSAIQNAAGEPQ